MRNPIFGLHENWVKTRASKIPGAVPLQRIASPLHKVRAAGMQAKDSILVPDKAIDVPRDRRCLLVVELEGFGDVGLSIHLTHRLPTEMGAHNLEAVRWNHMGKSSTTNPLDSLSTAVWSQD
jgi:hypothetical protein